MESIKENAGGGGAAGAGGRQGLSHGEMSHASPLHHSPGDLTYSRRSGDKLKPDFMSSDQCQQLVPGYQKK